MPLIPIWKTVADAYGMVFGDLKGVFFLAWLPWLVSFLAGILFGFVGDALGLPPLLYFGASGLVSAIMGTLFAVAMHRRFLFGISPATGRIRFRFGLAERLFLGVAVFWLAYQFLPLLTFSEDGVGVGLTTVVVALGFVLMAFAAGAALTLPAAAQGQPHPIQVGWNLGKGMRLRLMAIILLTSVPVSFLNRAMGFVDGTAGYVASLLGSFLYFAFSAFTIAGLCSAYKVRTAALEQAEDPAPEAMPEA